MDLHNKIRQLREMQDRKLTQQDLADALQTSQRKVSRWETGESDPSLTDLRKICQYYGVSADYLLDLPRGLQYP